MEGSEPGWVGKSCGQHGPYTFYRSFRYKKNSRWKSLSMGDFFFVRCSENEPLCIAEIKLLWETSHSEGVKLTSSCLYFLPECTPEGRMERHGEDEVLAVRDKVVLKAEDLVEWVVTDVDWSHGGPTIWEGVSDTSGSPSDVPHEEDDRDKRQVIITGYNKYCRHKAMLRRLEGTATSHWASPMARAMGLIVVPNKGVKILFCREVFDHPSLAENEKLCDHLAPKLKGRPRKRKSFTADAVDDGENPKIVHMTRATVKKEEEPMRRPRRKSVKLGPGIRRGVGKEEAAFLERFYKFMNDRSTPIQRLPSIGFKQINLFDFFTTTQRYGGHESITTQRLWKKIYLELGGNPGCTSAATCTRRHYEKFIEPYVKHLNKMKGGNAKLRLKGSKRAKKTDTAPPATTLLVPDVRPRKRTKKVREHLEELKERRAAQQNTNGLHLIPLQDLSTVLSSSLPGNTIVTEVNRDANFNIEPKSLVSSMGTPSVTLSKLTPTQLLRPDDLRHKLNSKHRGYGKTMTIKHFIDQEVTKDLSNSVGTPPPREASPSVTPSPPVMSRPSVIQHTQKPSTMQAERYSPHWQAVQPSDLILRNIANEASSSFSEDQTSKGATPTPASIPSEQLNHLRPPFVFRGMPPYLRQFVPYPSPFMHPRMPLMNIPPGKRAALPQRLPQDLYNLKEHTIPPKAHQVPVIQPASNMTSNLPEQEEPCDLSLPKKRKPPENDASLKIRELSRLQKAGSNGIQKLNPLAAYDSNRHRTTTVKEFLSSRQTSVNSQREGACHTEQPQRNPSKRFKMTPNPRGSITQGVINAGYPPTPGTQGRRPRDEKRSGTIDAKLSPINLNGIPPFMYPGMTGFMAAAAATRGMAPFPLLPGYFRPGFPAMVQTPAGFLPQTAFLPQPHSPLLGATVPTSVAREQGETMLPRGVIMPGPMAFSMASMYPTSVPTVAADKQPDT